jgi:predicted dienelactone hydrolase
VSGLDVILLVSVVGLAIWRIVSPLRHARWRLGAGLALAALCLLQLGLEGFYWQLLPAYAVLAVAILPPLRRGRLARGMGALALGSLALAAAASWMLLPIPRIPAPDGPYGVGSEVFRWVDTRRLETTTEEPLDHRNVVAQVWYPVAPGTRGTQAAYLDGLGRLPERVSGLPRFIFRHFDKVETHAIARAPISAARDRWPVIVFSPGYGAPRGFYTGLITRLVSQGYVVLALDHPYEAGVTQLADGRVVAHQQSAGGPDAARGQYMDEQIEVRVADLQFALDQIARPDGLGPQLSRRVDLRRIATIGHSFGGATAVLALERDPRILAAADVDGFLWGAFSGQPPRGPLLILESDHPDTPGTRAFVARTLAVLGDAPNGGYRYRIKGAHHFSFTDPLLYFSPPGQFVLDRALGGGRSAAETQRATVEILSAFLSGPLTGRAGDVAGVVTRAGRISGGPIGGGATFMNQGILPD